MADSAVVTSEVDAMDARRTLVPPARDLAAGVPLPPVEPPLVAEPSGLAEGVAEAPRPSFLRSTVGQLHPFAIGGRRTGTALLIIAIVGLMTGADVQIFGVLLPKMRGAFGGDFTFVLIVGQVFRFLSLLALPFVGLLADRIRRVWMLRAGGLVTAVGSTLIGVAGAPLHLIGLSSLSYFGTAVSGTAVPPLVSDYVPPASRGRGFAFVFQFALIGGVGVPVLIGFLADNVGWRGAYLAIGAVSIVAACFYFVLREPVRGASDLAAMGESEVTPPVLPKVSLAESFRRARASATLRRMWYAQIFMGMWGYATLTIALYMADTFQLTSTQYGLVLAAESATLFFALFVIGPLIDRWLTSSPSTVMYALAAMPLVMAGELVALWLAPSVWIAIPALIVGSTAAFLATPQFSPALNAVLSLVVPARIRGFGIQSIQPWGLLSIVLLALVGGTLQATGVDERTRLLSFVPFLIIGALIFAFAASGVAGDIRSALAATRAEEDIEREARAGERPLLVCRGVEVAYDGAQVLFGVDLTLRPGEIVALLGTNGAGKSTLLNAITGLQPASSGAVYFDGDDITYVPPDEIARRGVMLMPGGRALFPSLTVRENLEAVRWAKGGTAHDELDDALQRFPQLRARMSTQAGELSGGEQQQVALAQAFLRRPRLLLVDELSLGLAPNIVSGLLDGLRELARSGITVVIVEQSVNVALQIAQRAVFMEKGRVVFEGAVADLIARPDIVRSVFLTHAGAASTLTTRLRPEERDAQEAAAVTASDIAVRFGGVQVLDGISLAVERGDIVGIVGPNGAGKTTLFDAIAGSVRPQRGAVYLGSRDVTQLSIDARARLGLVRSYQNVRLFPALTVRENIAVALERHLHTPSMVQAAVWAPGTRRVERRIERRVDNLVESLGLESAANKFLSELSTGMRRIVDIACLLAAQPEVLLLDEPSSGLAQAEVEQLGPVVRRTVAETGCALLIIEHDLGLVSSLAHRLVALNLGTVMAEGTPSDVLAREDVVSALLGSSRGQQEVAVHGG